MPPATSSTSSSYSTYSIFTRFRGFKATRNGFEIQSDQSDLSLVTTTDAINYCNEGGCSDCVFCPRTRMCMCG